MKSLLSLTILFISLSTCLFGQSNRINQHDINGKKAGTWILYLDQNWEVIDDSTNAVFIRYTYFENGKNIYPMGPSGGKGFSLKPQPAKTDEPILLDGEYKWYDNKGRLSSIHEFKNGKYISCKEYFQTGELSQHFDYTKKCEGHLNGWTVFIYDKKGNLKQSFMVCKDENGNWPKMRG